MSHRPISSKTFYVVGLGNQGTEFTYTRHNIGRLSLERLVTHLGLTWQCHSGYDLVTFTPNLLSHPNTPILHGGSYESITLVRLAGFMNLCGQPLSRLISSSSTMTTSTPSILLLHDDLEKKFAQLSFKFQGSANGHNGVASVHSFVGRHVHRLRIGIGRPPTRTSDVIQKYVLSPFTRLEMKFFESEGFLSIWRAILDWTNEIKLKNSS